MYIIIYYFTYPLHKVDLNLKSNNDNHHDKSFLDCHVEVS